MDSARAIRRVATPRCATTTGVRIVWLLMPGAYSVTIARDTDSGNATFTVSEAGASSEPIVVDVLMIARPSVGDGSR